MRYKTLTLGFLAGWALSVIPAAVADDAPATVTSSCDACGKERGRGRSTTRRGLKARLQQWKWGYPEYFEEPEFGSSVNAALASQITAGEAAQLVVYHYDFDPEAAAIKPAGMRKLSRLVRLLERNPSSLIIESSGDETLDESRRQSVVRALKSLASTDMADRVVVAVPVRRGLLPEETQPIYDKLREPQTGIGGSGMSAGIPGQQQQVFDVPRGVPSRRPVR